MRNRSRSMRLLTILASIVLVGLILPIPSGFPSAHGLSASPTFSAALSIGDTSVSIAMQVSQNLTFLDRSFSLPQYRGRLVGQNASVVFALVQDSIRTLTPQASVSSLSLSLSSSSPTNGTTPQWFNVSLQFHVQGTQVSENGNEKTDMSWKSFVISPNVTIGTVEVNALGNAYMRSAGSFLRSLEAPQQGTFTFRNLVNDRVVTAVGLPSAVSKIQLLNFTRLLPQVDTWKQGYDFASKSATWSLNTDVLGLSIQEKVTEPQSTETINSGVFYSIQADILAPSRSFAQRDMIILVFQDTSETVMGLVIVSVVVLGLVSYVYENRYLKSRSVRKSKR
jgi:hypothetical protein